MAGETTPGSSGSKSTREMEPTEFTAENLSKHNKAPLINSLLKTKAKETALSEKQTEIHNIITAVIKKLKNTSDKTDAKAIVENGVESLEKINWKLKVNESFALAQNKGDNKNLIEVEASENKSNVTNTNSSINPSKVTKLDSNTLTYSNKPGERLDEWLL